MIMKKIFTMMLSAMFVAGVMAQRPEGVIMKASVPPVIGAEIDAVWEDANVYPIDLPYRLEVPTVDGTTWKALWDEAGIYVLVECLDDAWLPMYLDGGVNNWEYDKPEIYFDVNYVLADGLGASGTNGHYQLAPGPLVDQNDGRVLTTTFQGSPDIEAVYAITVSEPNANYMYFVPMEALVDAEGIMVDLTGTVGFDVTMIDRDPGDPARKRAVWANIGDLDESWSNMDDCGYITFDGAEAGVYVESISIEDAVIDENNGMVQIMATILPEDATNKNLKWTVTNGTGKAKISKEGVITGIMDGTVTVTAAATDGSYMDDMCTVTISNQIISRPEINLVRNGYMKELEPNGSASEWNGGNIVTEGVMQIDPNPNGVNYWDYTVTQQTFGCNTTDGYTFSFVLWADESDTVNVDFEDSNNGYNRYGSSTHELANGGESDWTFVSETTPTKYVFDVVFNEKVENTRESLQFMVGLHDPVLYIDSVELILDADLALITDYIAVESITVSGEATVAVDGTVAMSAEVLPANALLTGVRWSVVNGTGEATIDAEGVLTGVAAGVVTVVATAKDDSEVTGVMDVTVGATGISQKSVNTLKVYPNPAVNELNVVLNAENTTVSIYNGVGQKMDEAVVSGSEYKFDISSYAAGIYFVKTGTSIAKFVK
jgi:uncharacterized protein YjdB